MKNVTVFTEDGAFALFFRPHPGDLTAQESPPPGIYHPRQKKNVNARESAWGEGGGGKGWAQLALTDALRPPEHVAKEISRLIVLSRLTRPTGL